jgi:hypothetical protein
VTASCRAALCCLGILVSVPPLPAQEPKPAENVIRSAKSGPWSQAATWEGGKVLVRGTTSDNGTVKRVLVNGKEARAVAPNFAQWEVELEGLQPGKRAVTAHAEGAAGNVEKTPHQVAVVVR